MSHAETEPHSHALKKGDKMLPVTILTGFLGAGKTTLLSYILQDKSHQLKIAVINNEFSQNVKVGTASELESKEHKGSVAVQADIYETGSGCLCCGGGGDDFRGILHELVHMKDKIDYVIVETTGLADPSFSKMFFLDPILSKHFTLDGIVTMVDSKHVLQQLALGSTHKDEEQGITVVNETIEQIAVADCIVLNKIDLVSTAEVDTLEKTVQGLNPSATILRSEYSRLADLQKILNIKSFNLDRVLEYDKGFLEFRPLRTHSNTMQSVALIGKGLLTDKLAVTKWLNKVVTQYGVLRTKGVLHMQDKLGDKQVIQGVRDMVDITARATWNQQEEKHHRIVFIGDNMENYGPAILKAFKEEVAAAYEDGSVKMTVFQPPLTPGGKADLVRLLVMIVVLVLVYFYG